MLSSNLPREAQHELEMLMMQGDMIELSLDESQILWKLYRACQPNTELPAIRNKVSDVVWFLTFLGLKGNRYWILALTFYNTSTYPCVCLFPSVKQIG